MKFKIGDIVVLKSGSPALTVHGQARDLSDLEMTDILECVWFNDNDEVQRTRLHQDTLELDESGAE